MKEKLPIDLTLLEAANLIAYLNDELRHRKKPKIWMRRVLIKLTRAAGIKYPDTYQ